MAAPAIGPRFCNRDFGALLAGFFRWTSTVGVDVVSDWRSFDEVCQDVLLLPYYLLSWPLLMGLGALWSNSLRSFLIGYVVTIYAVGVLGYAAIARYLLIGRVKQAFSRPS